MTGGVGPVVVGGGVAGLVVAEALAGAGLAPVVLEAADDVGGLVRRGSVGGYEVDLGAEAFATRRPEVADLARSLGLDVEAPAHGSWVWTPRRAFPVPDGLLGIPAAPTDPALSRVLSPDGAARAAAEADLPPSVGAGERTLAGLVRARFGEEVLDKLVRPVAGGIHSADPADLAVDAVAPGLRAGLAEHGSLTAAVRAARAARPGPAVAGVAGGLHRLPAALAARVRSRGGAVLTGRVVRAVRRVAGGFEVDVAGGAGPGRLTTTTLVLATGADAAVPLLASLVPGPVPAPPPGSTVVHVTLAVDAPGLDAAPRGAGVLVPQTGAPGPAAAGSDRTDGAPGGHRVRAKALTHASVKWSWLARRTGPGEHVLRLSYGRPGEPLPPAGPDLAVADARVLLATPVGAPRDAVVVRHENVLAPATPAYRREVADLVARVAGVPGLAVTGAWVAGTGVAAVVAHAQEVAAALTGLRGEAPRIAPGNPGAL